MMPGRGGILRGDRWAKSLREALAREGDDTASWMERHTQILKSDEHSRVGLLELEGELCYLKFYRQKSLGQQFMFWLARGRGVQAFDAADKLAQQDIAVPAARACILVPGGILLLTEGLEGARDLKAVWQGDLSGEDRKTLMNEVGQVLGKLHRQAFAHGDCKWSNLLRHEEKFYLVDLEGTDRAVVGGGKQARDLARFTVNAEDLGVTEPEFSPFMDTYCRLLETPQEVIVDRMMPDLKRYRARHRARYGERGAQLF